MIVKSASIYDNFPYFLNTIKTRLSIVVLIAVAFAFFMKNQNTYYLMLVFFSALATGVLRESVQFYEVKVKHFLQPTTLYPYGYTSGIYWTVVFAFSFGLALFNATIHMDSFSRFQHFIECLYFGACYVYWSMVLHYIYLKMNYSIQDNYLDK